MGGLWSGREGIGGYGLDQGCGCRKGGSVSEGGGLMDEGLEELWVGCGDWCGDGWLWCGDG